VLNCAVARSGSADLPGRPLVCQRDRASPPPLRLPIRRQLV